MTHLGPNIKISAYSRSPKTVWIFCSLFQNPEFLTTPGYFRYSRSFNLFRMADSFSGMKKVENLVAHR